METDSVILERAGYVRIATSSKGAMAMAELAERIANRYANKGRIKPSMAYLSLSSDYLKQAVALEEKSHQ